MKYYYEYIRITIKEQDGWILRKIVSDLTISLVFPLLVDRHCLKAKYSLPVY